MLPPTTLMVLDMQKRHTSSAGQVTVSASLLNHLPRMSGEMNAPRRAHAMLLRGDVVDSHVERAMADRIDALTERVQAVETHVQTVELKLDRLSGKVDGLSASVDQKFEAVDAAILEQRQYTEFAFSRLEARMDAGYVRLEAKMDAGFSRMDAGFSRSGERLDRLERKLDQFIDLHL